MSLSRTQLKLAADQRSQPPSVGDGWFVRVAVIGPRIMAMSFTWLINVETLYYLILGRRRESFTANRHVGLWLRVGCMRRTERRLGVRHPTRTATSVNRNGQDGHLLRDCLGRGIWRRAHQKKKKKTASPKERSACMVYSLLTYSLGFTRRLGIK